MTRDLLLTDINEIEEIIKRVIRSEMNNFLIEIKGMVDKMNEAHFSLDDYYTLEELCDLLSVTPQTVHSFEKKSLIVPKRVGRKKLYQRREINSLINDNKLACFDKSSE